MTITKVGELREKAGSIEYKMPIAFANEITKGTKGKKNAQEVLVEYVNENCGLLYNCTRVITY